MNEEYRPTTRLIDIIDNIISSIDDRPDYIHSLNKECSEEYRNDFNTFYKKALEMTLSYGRPRY